MYFEYEGTKSFAQKAPLILCGVALSSRLSTNVFSFYIRPDKKISLTMSILTLI